MDVTKEVQAIIDEGEKRGLYDTSKLGPELVAFFHDRAGMLAGLRDEMSEGYQGWLDDCVAALNVARDHFAGLTTAQSEAAELRKEVERLRGALGEFADRLCVASGQLHNVRDWHDSDSLECVPDESDTTAETLWDWVFEPAHRAALKEAQHEG